MYKLYFYNIHESKFFICSSLIFLSFLSIFIGYIFSDSFIGVGSLFINSLTFLNINKYLIFDVEFDLYFIKFLPLIISLFGMFLFFIFYNYMNIINYNNIYVIIFKFFNKAMLFDYFYNHFVIEGLLKFSYFNMYKKLEKGLFEYFSYIYVIKILNNI